MSCVTPNEWRALHKNAVTAKIEKGLQKGDAVIYIHDVVLVSTAREIEEEYGKRGFFMKAEYIGSTCCCFRISDTV
jgi:hypothetical protein